MLPRRPNGSADRAWLAPGALTEPWSPGPALKVQTLRRYDFAMYLRFTAAMHSFKLPRSITSAVSLGIVHWRKIDEFSYPNIA